MSRKAGASVKWGSDGAVKISHSGRKEDIGKEFTFRNADGEEVHCSSRLLTKAELQGGGGTYTDETTELTAGTRIVYRNHGMGTEHKVVVGGAPPSRRRRSRGTSESDDVDADDSGVRTAGDVG